MRKILLLLAALLGASSLWAFSSFTLGDIRYEVTKSYPPYEVMVYSASRDITSAKLSSTVQYSGYTFTVTAIDYEAFANCTQLTQLYIPKSVTRIGRDAFYNTPIYNNPSHWQDGLLYAGDCLIKCKAYDLNELVLKQGTRLIAQDALKGCDQLRAVLTNNPNLLGFDESGLQIPFCEDVLIYGDRVVNDLVYNKTTLVYVIDPIEKTNIVLPPNTTHIGDRVFANCENLESITIPSAVTSIGEGAFSGCEMLKSITLPDKLTYIGNEAFFGCNSLKSITIPNSVKHLGEYFDYECLYSNGSIFTLCRALESVQLNSKITDLKEGCFRGCTSLKQISVPSNVARIEDCAFYGCSALEHISLAEGLTSIGSTADSEYEHLILSDIYGVFNGCKSLRSIVIPSSVTFIGDSTFANCPNLQEVILMNKNVTFGKGVFAGSTPRILYADTIIDGCVVSDGTILNIPNASTITSFVMPKGTQTIDPNLLKRCEALHTITLSEGMTQVPDEAFAGCQQLQSVILPPSILSLGKNCFEGCVSLTSVRMPDSLLMLGAGAFSGCTALSTIQLPSSLTAIGDACFDGCTHLQDISLPAQLQLLGKAAFRNCHMITSIAIPQAITTIPEEAFSGCRSLTTIDWHQRITEIAQSAFAFCTSLQEVNLPEQLRTIGKRAFQQCTALAKMVLPRSVKTISEYAFYETSNLKVVLVMNPSLQIVEGYFLASSPAIVYADKIIGDLVIRNDVLTYIIDKAITHVAVPEGVTAIGAAAFANCHALQSVDLPASVREIQTLAFMHCTSLTSITIPSAVTDIPSGTFHGCSSLTDVILPAGVTSIGNYAFLECRSLKSIELPSALAMLGESVFAGCSSLTSVTLPVGLTAMMHRLFANCSSLASITIPDSIQSISSDAFVGCVALTEVNWRAEHCSDFVGASPLPAGVSSLIVGENVQTLPSYLLYGNTNVTSVTLPAAVTHVGDYAFSHCQMLQTVTLPESIEFFGMGVFNDSPSLQEIRVPRKKVASYNKLGLKEYRNLIVKY